MPVVEYTSLQLISPYTLETEAVRDLLEGGCARQAAHSTYPVYLFTNASDASIIYLISGWTSVAQHLQYAGSEENRKAMGSFGDYLTIKGLGHPVIDVSAFPTDVAVVTVEKYAGDKGASEAVESNLPTAKWVGEGIDEETKGGYKISAFGPEDKDVVLSFGVGVNEIDVLILVKAFRG
ncbi:hypothetical protein DXG03_001338 [Asterophora parasitica]|uniref:ABM domain-containing protein n=1 Tax=Asterophora parasitica TaxID=117018 RepID=A0A9P7G374_9AGAR|nr:hypothetical protein DXG03_001338 [Asterophora parasitica]